VKGALRRLNHANLPSGIQRSEFSWGVYLAFTPLFSLLASFLGNLALLFPEKRFRGPGSPASDTSAGLNFAAVHAKRAFSLNYETPI
jgi:Ni/Fe-hydrogenase subunit HybB-like protein